MRADADDPARVRNPAIELLLNHTATLTDEPCSRPRPVDNGLRASADYMFPKRTPGNRRVNVPTYRSPTCL